MKTISYFILVAAVLLSCSKNKDDKNQTQNGYFILSQVNALKSQKTTNSGSFNLGDIRKSTAFYFTIANGGNTPIYNINLSFSKNIFTISPTNFGSLDISNKNISVSQILKVGALHGTLIEGTGYASLLPAGNNVNTLTITGKTISGKDSINISETFNMQLNALVADLSLQNDSGLIDLTKSSSFAYSNSSIRDSTKYNGINELRAHDYYTPNIKVTNTGNVPLTISMFNRQDGGGSNIDPHFYTKYFILMPGEVSANIVLPTCPASEYAFPVCFKIFCEGTISDITKFQIGTDGYLYFVMSTRVK